MWIITRAALVLVAVVGITACGDDNGGSSGSPSSPSTPSTPTNRAPVISSITISPSWGVSQLTTFNYSASASDADNDALTYQWDLAGSSRTGSSGSIIFTALLTGVPAAFAWTGIASAYLKAGFIEIARRSRTRPIIRIEITPGSAL